MNYIIAIIFIISLAYVSCGTQESEVGSSDTTASDFQTEKDLEYDEAGDYFRIPRCTRGKDETLIYLRYEEILLVCRSGQWYYFDDPLESGSDDAPECPITQPVVEPEEDDDDDDQKEVHKKTGS